MWRRVVCWDATDVSEEHSLHLQGRRWRRYVPPKRRLHLNRPYGVTSQKMILFRRTAVKTSNPTGVRCLGDHETLKREDTRRAGWNSRIKSHVIRKWINYINVPGVGMETGYRLEGPGLIPCSARFFSSPQCPDRIWGPPRLLSNRYRGLFLRAVKRPGREADHLPPSTAEDKKGGAIPPLPHTSSWHSAQLIKQRATSPFMCQ
jgi:hypothetical protein